MQAHLSMTIAHIIEHLATRPFDLEEIRGSDVTLRPLRDRDLDWIFALYRETDVWGAFGWKEPRNRGQVGQIAAAMRKGFADDPRMYQVAFAIVCKGEQQPCGVITLKVANDAADLTIAIAKSGRRKHAALGAAQALFEWCRAKTPIRTILGNALHSNAASIELMKRLGMKDQGVQDAAGDGRSVRHFESDLKP